MKEQTIKDFEIIGNILPELAESWRGKVFLTFDVDWASDAVLEFTLDLVEQADVAATWFITHDTPLLQRIEKNSKFEIGLHPNFNFLMRENPEVGHCGATGVLENIKKIAPDATTVRSHSLSQSSRLLDIFKDAGVSHDCNMFLPAHTGMVLCPWRHWNGMVRVPHGWEDDVWVAEGSKQGHLAFAEESLMVVDFHPIHIALNTLKFKDYEDSRDDHNDWAALQSKTRSGFGVRRVFENFLETGSLL